MSHPNSKYSKHSLFPGEASESMHAQTKLKSIYNFESESERACVLICVCLCVAMRIYTSIFLIRTDFPSRPSTAPVQGRQEARYTRVRNVLSAFRSKLLWHGCGSVCVIATIGLQPFSVCVCVCVCVCLGVGMVCVWVCGMTGGWLQPMATHTHIVDTTKIKRPFNSSRMVLPVKWSEKLLQNELHGGPSRTFCCASRTGL